MIKATVFDLDHTLFDRYATIRKIVPGLREHFDLNDGITDEVFAEELCYGDKHNVHKVCSALTTLMGVAEALDMAVIVLVARAPIEGVGTKTNHTERCGGDRGNIARVGSTHHWAYKVGGSEVGLLCLCCRESKNSSRK